MFVHSIIALSTFTIFGFVLPRIWCYGLIAVVAIIAAIITFSMINANKTSKKGVGKDGNTPFDIRRRGILYALSVAVLFSIISVAYFSDINDINAEHAQTITDVVSDSSLPDNQRVEQIVALMSIEEKAAQLVQDEYTSAGSAPALFAYPLGSVLSGGGSLSDSVETADEWNARVDSYQSVIMRKSAPIPVIYGIDAVHGLGKMRGAVIFPHNIGIGAANNPTLTYEMGKAVAEEMKLANIRLNFAPCVAICDDPRWGRTYECYSSEEAIVTRLGTAFAQGQLDAGVMPTAKHYIADGSTIYGSAYGANGTPLDRGNSELTEEEIRSIYIKPYEALLNSGVKVVMASFSSLNDVKMHENGYLLNDVLKGELGFDGFVISDYLAIELLSGDSFKENVALAINAGVDMLMQPGHANETVEAIIINVENGTISEERLNDAVTRILRVKLQMGLFDDPYQNKVSHAITEVGSEEYRDIAKQLVEQSLVLIKNNDRVLPLKENSKILVIGDAMDDLGVQCGGWTGSWQGQTEADFPDCVVGTSILDGLNEYAQQYNVEIITDKAKVNEADAIILAIGEVPYAEWNGDTEDMSITGSLALANNKADIDFAKRSGKPTITLIVAGRQPIITEYINDWDAVVMCYLPGSEGDGVASVLYGETDFIGKLPMPWFYSTDEITSKDPLMLYDVGHGLNYGWMTAE